MRLRYCRFNHESGRASGSFGRDSETPNSWFLLVSILLKVRNYFNIIPILVASCLRYASVSIHLVVHITYVDLVALVLVLYHAVCTLIFLPVHVVVALLIPAVRERCWCLSHDQQPKNPRE